MVPVVTKTSSGRSKNSVIVDRDVNSQIKAIFAKLKQVDFDNQYMKSQMNSIDERLANLNEIFEGIKNVAVNQEDTPGGVCDMEKECFKEMTRQRLELEGKIYASEERIIRRFDEKHDELKALINELKDDKSKFMDRFTAPLITGVIIGVVLFILERFA